MGACEFEVVEWIEDKEAEAECVGRAVRPFGLLRFDTELEADPSCGEDVKIDGEVGFVSFCSCPSHQSHTTQPSTVAHDPHPTTAPGDTFSWYIPTKHAMKIATEHTCCTMTVESATRGQKSYG